MKKILSVLLTALMLFSVLGIGVSAATDYDALIDTSTQVIIRYNLNSGTMKLPVPVYDPALGDMVNTSGVTGIYYAIPMDKQSQVVGDFISLPYVTAPSGKQFDGWYCYEDKQTYAAGGSYQIPNGKQGQYISFVAQYSPADVQPDTLSTILGLLIKVFGTIAGVLIYGGDTAQGIALMEGIFGAFLK